MFKKIVVFDLDDTLISEKDYINSGFNIISKKIARDYNLNDKKIKKKMNDLFSLSNLNLFNRTLDYFDIKYDLDYIKELVFIYRNHIPTIKLYDDAYEILEFLSKNGYRLGMITDGYKETQKNKIKVLDIQKYFEHIVITDELGRMFWKPSEIPYKIIKERFGCEYADMVYIGDNVEKDFITANKLGIKTIQILRENRIYKNIEKPREFLPQKYIKNLKELLKIKIIWVDLWNISIKISRYKILL